MKDRVLELLTQADFEKQQGNIEVATNTLDEAKNLLQDVAGIQKSNRNNTSEDTKEIIYLHKYGNILYGIEEYEQSLKYYEEIAEKQLKPKVNICKALGDCLRKLTRYDEALEQYNEALKAYEQKIDMSASSEAKAAVHNSMGLTYVVKAQNEKALKAFIDAINASTKNPNPLYYCNKGSILLGITGRKEEGLNCFNEAVTLVNKRKIKGLTMQNITYITKILAPYIKLENEVKGIQAKLGGVQRKVDAEQLHELQEKYNKLQEDHNELVEIVKNNTLKQEDYNTLVEAHYTELTKKISEVKTDVQLVETNLQVLGTSLQVVEMDLQFKQKDIEEIKEQLYELVTKEEFEKLQSNFKIKFSMFDNRLNIMQTNVTGMRKWKVHIDDTLKKANIFTEVKIKEKLESLEQDHGKEVYEYATMFYQTLKDSLSAYSAISTGLIKVNSEIAKGIVKIIFDILNLGGSRCPPIAIVLGIISVLNGFYEKYKDAKIELVAKKVADSMSSGITFSKDLDIAMASSAYKIAIAKKQTIKEAETKELTKIQKVKDNVNYKLDKALSKITKIPNVDTSKVGKMALEDVALFIVYSIAKSGVSLVRVEDAEKLNKAIESRFGSADTGIEQLFSELYNNHLQCSANVTVVNVDSIVYNNHLLNNLELMKDVTKLWGGNFNEVLKLSKELSPDLIKEAIENNDPSIVLGGLLSLADNSSECI